jgi:hypothetical protein
MQIHVRDRSLSEMFSSGRMLVLQNKMSNWPNIPKSCLGDILGHSKQAKGHFAP